MPYGVARTEEERRARHKALYGDEPPPARGGPGNPTSKIEWEADDCERLWRSEHPNTDPKGDQIMMQLITIGCNPLGEDFITTKTGKLKRAPQLCNNLKKVGIPQSWTKLNPNFWNKVSGKTVTEAMAVAKAEGLDKVVDLLANRLDRKRATTAVCPTDLDISKSREAECNEALEEMDRLTQVIKEKCR